MKKLVSLVIFMLLMIGCGQIQHLTESASTPSYRINAPGCEGEEVPVCLGSEPGDYILRGGKIAPSADKVKVEIGGGLIVVKFESWVIQLFTNTGEDVKVGWYPNAERYPFQKAGLPGLSVAGEGRGCNEIAGAFEIQAYRRTPTGLVLDARLIQYCEKAKPALYGWIRIGM
jgi:hypothetical protein